jgi:hypothetical protein
MGLSFWVLEEVGFGLRRAGRALAETTWWLMVIGVAGVLVSTLALHFAGSWVFLYPLPFHAAAQWGRWATAIFAASVLLAGLSIVTWCLAILDTVLGPALHAVSYNVLNRLGVAIGLGYLWPPVRLRGLDTGGAPVRRDDRGRAGAVRGQHGANAARGRTA